MFATSLIQFVIIQVGFAFSPGLIITLIVRTTLTKDRRSGVNVALGAALGCLIITIFSAYIISFVVEKVPLVLEYVTYVGSSYIIYKAFNILRTSNKQIEMEETKTPFLEGFKINCLNPKMILLYLTVLPLFLDVSQSIFWGMIYLGLITTGVNIIADLTWCFVAGIVKENININNKVVDKLAGTILLVLGVGILFNQIV
ncbi:MAG: LysE family translocator [Actinomycetota bacterium]|nr:LysE family translocator [Actinomycetota bacterium]